MLTKQRKESITRNSKQLNIKLAVIYFLLVLLFISLMILL